MVASPRCARVWAARRVFPPLWPADKEGRRWEVRQGGADVRAVRVRGATCKVLQSTLCTERVRKNGHGWGLEAVLDSYCRIHELKRSRPSARFATGRGRQAATRPPGGAPVRPKVDRDRDENASQGVLCPMSDTIPEQWDLMRCHACGSEWGVATEGQHSHRMECPICEGTAEHYATVTERPFSDTDSIEERERQRRQNPTLRAQDRALKSTCPFCGVLLIKQNQSAEHILAKWLRKVPPIPDAMKVRTGGARRWAEPDIRMGAKGQVILGPSRAFDSKHVHAMFGTVAVCADCNNGWMSSLEQEVEPTLAPLVSGIKTEVTPEEARQLARWLGKVHVAYERDDPATAFAHAAQIRDVRAGRPPRWSSVWIARHDSPLKTMLRHSPNTGYVEGTSIVVGRNARTTVSLGHVFLQIVVNDRPLFELTPFEPSAPWRLIYPSAESMEVDAAGTDSAAILAFDESMYVAVLPNPLSD